MIRDAGVGVYDSDGWRRDARVCAGVGSAALESKMTTTRPLLLSAPLCASLLAACGPHAKDPARDLPSPDAAQPDDDARPSVDTLASDAQPAAGPGFEGECFGCDADRDQCLLDCDDDLTVCIVTCEECETPSGECEPDPACFVQCERTYGECTPKCEEEFGDCWEEEGCDDLDDDCEDCIQNCHEICQGEPEDLFGDCVTACEGFQDACWQSKECDGPYVDVTPICNYLDRGINDFETGIIDVYEVVPPGIATLADIHKFEFGLDMPGTNCSTGDGIPCADQDYATQWTFDEVAMLVSGVPFFHAVKGPDDPHLQLVTGGSKDAGITGWDLAEIQANPFWGISQQELDVFYSELPVNSGLALPTVEDFKLSMPTIFMSAPRMAHTVEGALGQALAERIKTGYGYDTACAGEIYCDNKRNYQAAWRGTYNNGFVDCDFGGCPPVTDRDSSPWVELRGDGDRLTVSADLEVLDGKPDKTDCPDGSILCDEPNGTNYKWLADIGVELELRAICTGAPGGTKSIRLDLEEVTVTIEDGTTLVALAEKRVQEILDNDVAKVILQQWQTQTLIDELEVCPDPVADFAPSGSFFMDQEVDGVCMPEAYVLDDPECEDECVNGFGCIDGECVVGAGAELERNCAGHDDCGEGEHCTVSTGRTMEPAQFVEWARIRAQPAGSAADALEAAYGDHVADIPWDLPFFPSVAGDVLGDPEPTTKVPFATLTAMEAPVCALATGWRAHLDDDDVLDYASTCAPDIDLAAIALPPPDVTPGGLAFTCDPAIPPGDPANDEACDQLGRIKAFIMQPEIYTKCVMHQLPPGVIPDDAIAAQVWDAFEGVVAGCEAATLPFESLIPVPGIDITLLTGTTPATDTFAFVDVTDVEGLRESAHESKKCRNRLDLDAIDPYEYPDCVDADDPSVFGLEGCPCADIDILDFDEILDDGGYPDGAGSYAEHGLEGPGQYCEDDGDGPLVCGRVRHQGRDFPVCQRCHEDTKFGCTCETDGDCEGIEDGLRCVGSSAAQDWMGGVAGQCLPDPGILAGQEALEETRWFCLDNCDSIDGNGGEVGGCYFNQHTAQVDHGTCINTLNECGSPSPGICEEDGNVCRENADAVEVCEPECDAGTDCAALGFPPHFVCDDHSPGHCVPPECAAVDGIWSFCELYR